MDAVRISKRLSYVLRHDRAGTRIRASQGHSVTVDLGYGAPPAELLHGTVDRSLPAILTEACSRDAATRST